VTCWLTASLPLVLLCNTVATPLVVSRIIWMTPKWKRERERERGREKRGRAERVREERVGKGKEWVRDRERLPKERESDHLMPASIARCMHSIGPPYSMLVTMGWPANDRLVYMYCIFFCSWFKHCQRECSFGFISSWKKRKFHLFLKLSHENTSDENGVFFDRQNGFRKIFAISTCCSQTCGKSRKFSSSDYDSILCIVSNCFVVKTFCQSIVFVNARDPDRFGCHSRSDSTKAKTKMGRKGRPST
jgi:hypothetical protein